MCRDLQFREISDWGHVREVCLRVPGACPVCVADGPGAVYVLVLSQEFHRCLFITICRALVGVLLE